MGHSTRSAAILAGGLASRFGGTDKGALLVDGRTIFDRQVAELSSLTGDVLVVRATDVVRDGGTQRLGPRVVTALVPVCGPLGGLHPALLEARVDVVVPETERGYHPLCAVYTRACLEPVAARLADRRLAMRDLVAAMRTRVVTAEEIDRFGDRHRLLANLNTP